MYPYAADPSLYGPQFQDWLGPLGSYGEPGATGVGHAGSGTPVIPGGMYGA